MKNIISKNFGKIGLIFVFMILYVLLYHRLFLCNLLDNDSGYQLALNNHSFSEIIRLISEDYHVPLFAILLKIFSYLPFPLVRCGRLLLVVIIFFHFVLAFFPLERLVGRKVSIIYSIFFLTSPIIVYFSSEIRMYSLTELNIMAFVIYYALCLKNNNKYDWLKLVIFGILACYSHLLASVFVLFLLGTTGVYFLINKKDKVMTKRIWCSFLIIFIAFSLWIPNLLKQLKNATSSRYYNSNSFISLFNLFRIFIAGIAYLLYYSPGVPFIIECIFIVLFILLMFIVLRSNFIHRRKKMNINMHMDIKLFGMCILELLLIIVFYGYCNSMYVERYFTIIYSLLLIFIIIYFSKNFNKYCYSCLILFFIAFCVMYKSVIIDDCYNLSYDVYGNISSDIKKMSSDKNNINLFHIFEGTLMNGYTNYFLDYNNYIVFSKSYGYVYGRNVLNDYSVFGNNVKVLNDISGIEGYTDEFFVLIYTFNSSKWDINDILSLGLFKYFNELDYSYEFVKNYYGAYNGYDFWLFKVKVG